MSRGRQTKTVPWKPSLLYLPLEPRLEHTALAPEGLSENRPRGHTSHLPTARPRSSLRQTARQEPRPAASL